MTNADLVAWADRVYPHVPGGPWRVYDDATDHPADDSGEDELLVGNGTNSVRFVRVPGIDRWDHNWKVRIVCTDNGRERTVQFTQAPRRRRPVHVISRIALELYGPTRCPKAWVMHLAVFLDGLVVACGQWWHGIGGAFLAMLLVALLFGLPFGALSTVPTIDAGEHDTDRGGSWGGTSGSTWYRSPAMRTCALTRWAFAYRKPHQVWLWALPLTLVVAIVPITLASPHRHWGTAFDGRGSFFGMAFFFSLVTAGPTIGILVVAGAFGYAIKDLYELPRRDDLTRHQRLARWYRALVGPTLLLAVLASIAMMALPHSYVYHDERNPRAAGFANFVVDLFSSTLQPQWLVWLVRIAFLAALTMMVIPSFFGGKGFADHLRETDQFDRVPDGVASYPWVRIPPGVGAAASRVQGRGVGR